MAAASDSDTAKSPTASTSKVLVEDASADKRHVIKEGDSVLIRLPSTLTKSYRLSPKNKIGLGKYGSFSASELVGKAYGDTFEIMSNGKLEPVRVTLNEIEETEATNENILSTGAQQLTFLEIEALKKEGVTGRNIIAKQIEEHAAYELKSEYSKDKYLKRKQAKFLPMFTVIEPTAHNICEYYLDKQSDKIRDLRPDTLAQILNHANVRPGGRTLLVENTHGLIVAAALDRMAGQGRLMLVRDIEGPPDVLITEHFNFPPQYLEPLVSVAWHGTDEDYELPNFVEATIATEEDEASAGQTALQTDDIAVRRKEERKSAKALKRKATTDKATADRNDYLAGEFDGCIIATDYEPYSVLEKLLPRLAGSASIVVHSQHYQVLQDLHVKLRQDRNFLAPSIIEPWLRKYQVLPGRTHPEMNGLPHGGFLLTAMRIFDDGGHVSAVSHARANKKRKREAAAAAGTASSAAASDATADTPEHTS